MVVNLHVAMSVCYISVPSWLQKNPNTIMDPSFYGVVVDWEPKCMMHQQRPNKFIAFEGFDAGKSFYDCAVQMRYVHLCWKTQFRHWIYKVIVDGAH